MKDTKKQLLRDSAVEPTNEVLAEALGEANAAYVAFLQELASHGIELVWRYYPDVKAWLAKGQIYWTGVRGGKKEATVFWLSVWSGFFKVTIYVPEKARVEALQLPLNEEVKQMILNSQTMGKFQFFPLVLDVSSSERFYDLFALLDFRKSLR